MNQTWRRRAHRELMDRRGGSCCWSYRTSQAPCVEPTALASLALRAAGGEGADAIAAKEAAIRAAAGWMAAIQRGDGSLPVSEYLATPGWTTPYGVLLWSGLPGFEVARRRAGNWLLEVRGWSLPITGESVAVIGHDTTLVGWPWVERTHSWLEPTALAILALGREGSGNHPRVREGIRLILDRALKEGGWNYGNKSVFGRDLRPQPGPTGLALLALAACGDRCAAASRALHYLRAALPNLRAAVSLGWGVLGLRAFDACPAEAESWLAEAYDQCTGRVDATMGLALLLLAAGERALGLLLPRNE